MRAWGSGQSPTTECRGAAPLRCSTSRQNVVRAQAKVGVSWRGGEPPPRRPTRAAQALRMRAPDRHESSAALGNVGQCASPVDKRTARESARSLRRDGGERGVQHKGGMRSSIKSSSFRSRNQIMLERRCNGLSGRPCRDPSAGGILCARRWRFLEHLTLRFARKSSEGRPDI